MGGFTGSDAPPRPRARMVLAVLGVVTLAVVAVPVLARALGWEAGPLAYLLALMPWIALASLIPVALALAARSWALVAAAAGIALLSWWWQAPLLTASAAVEDDAARVATLNVTFGGADADAVVALVRERDLDLLALEELTPAAAAALHEAGLDDLLPYSEVHAEEGFTGTGLWSRARMTDARSVPGYTSRVVMATTVLGGTERAVVAAHPMAPGATSNRLWRAELDALGALIAEAGPQVLVLGDLNAARDHAGLRAWEAADCVDAPDQAGAGFLPTFPEGRGPFPVAAIDHVYACGSDLRATSVAAVTVAGADHRALVVVYGTT